MPAAPPPPADSPDDAGPPKRRTKQRDAIERVVLGSERPLSPQEILDRGREEIASISLATVYRAIRALVDKGTIQAVELPGQPPRYEAAGLAHHHHFHCLTCGRAFDLPGCPVDLAGFAPEGFVVEDHELTLTGRCADCARER